MPGSGKTSVSERLKNNYNWNMIDTDHIIIKKHNMNLIDVVNKLGDEFLNEETTAVLSLNNIPPKTVISPGGSVVFSDVMMSHLSKLGVIIHLNSNINELLKRVTNFKERGIVMEEGETLRDIDDKRKPLYQKYRELSIDNSFLDIEEVSNMIHNLF